MRRMKVVLGHLPGGGQPRLLAAPCLALSGRAHPAAPEDVVVVHGRRTPIGKGKRGGLKDTTPDELLATVMTAVLKDLQLKPELLGDICVGNVLQPGAGALTARIGQFLSGIPETVPLSCVNRQCSSGLQAVINIAGGIRNGSYDIGLACGAVPRKMPATAAGETSGTTLPRPRPYNPEDPLQPMFSGRESLRQYIEVVEDWLKVLAGEKKTPVSVARSLSNGVMLYHSVDSRVESMSLRSVGNPGDVSSRMMENSNARDCLIPMGITSENVAERFGVSREKQDAFALASQQKAARAQHMGWFKNEIVPVTTTITNNQGKEETITVLQDEGIRPGTTLEGLAKLKPAFKEDGTTTAGNSSQVSDGAAAVLLARRSRASQLGLPILGVLRSYAVVGVPPDVMGIGPAYAIPAALEKAGLTVKDIDVFEINEAFASQALYCVEKLGIPLEKVNPLGGAIALGHPLGCTGARQVVTLLNELKRRGKRGYGVVSMCIGTGMGAAAVFEYPGN